MLEGSAQDLVVSQSGTNFRRNEEKRRAGDARVKLTCTSPRLRQSLSVVGFGLWVSGFGHGVNEKKLGKRLLNSMISDVRSYATGGSAEFFPPPIHSARD